MPGPLDSARAVIDLFATSTAIVVPVLGSNLVLPTGLAHLAQTLFHYVPGLLLGASCGIGLGLAMGWNGALDDWLRPLVRVLRPIPPLAWVVFAIVWFGIHHTGAAFIVFVGAFWINFYGAYGGVEGVSSDLTDAASTLGVERDLSMLKLGARECDEFQHREVALHAERRRSVSQVTRDAFDAPKIGRASCRERV